MQKERQVIEHQQAVASQFMLADAVGSAAFLDYVERRDGPMLVGRGLSFLDGWHRLALQGALVIGVAQMRAYPQGNSNPRFSPGSPIRITPPPGDRGSGTFGIFSADGRTRAGNVHPSRRERVRALAGGNQLQGFVIWEWLDPTGGSRRGIRILLAAWALRLRVVSAP